MHASANDDGTGGRDVYNWAVRLQAWGAQAALPITKGTKATYVSWTQYQLRQPDASELYHWFVEREDEEYGLGLLLGPSLVAMDFDIDDAPEGDGGFEAFCREYPQFRTLPRVRTGSGKVHVYFRPAKPLSRKFNKTAAELGIPNLNGVVEFRTHNHVAVMPPTPHPDTGVLYEWEIPPKRGFPVLDLAGAGIREPERSLVAVGREWQEGEPLDSNEIEAILSIIEPEWRDGIKHDLSLALAGWFAGHGVPEDSARTVLDRLVAGASPSERRHVIANVRDTYARVAVGDPVAGWSVLNRDNLLSSAALENLDHTMRARPVNYVESAITNPSRIQIPYVTSVEEFLALDLPKPEWLVKGLLSAATVNLRVGPPKTYKTFWEFELHLAMALGDDAFGLFPTGTARRTCYVQRELEASDWQDRIARMLIGRESDPEELEGRINLITGHSVRIDNADDMRRFTDGLLSRYPDTAYVTFDTLGKHHGSDENSNTEMKKVMDVLLRLRDEFRIAIGLVHHTNKNELASNFESVMKGAIEIWSSSDDGMLFTRIKDDDARVKKIQAMPDGRHLSGTAPFGYRVVDTREGGVTFETFPIGSGDGHQTSDMRVLLWLDSHLGWHDATTVRKAMGWSEKSKRAYTILTRLANNRKVRTRKDRDTNVMMFASLHDPDDDDLDF